jgi:hypothetical protein
VRLDQVGERLAVAVPRSPHQLDTHRPTLASRRPSVTDAATRY